MSLVKTWGALAIVVGLGACHGQGTDSAGVQPKAVVGLDHVDVASADKPRGVYFVAENKSPRIGPGPIRRIIYMNRFGGTYTNGNDNSATNRSIVPSGTSQVSPWSFGDAKWQQLMVCVRDQYARFDVEITETEPAANVQYIESVVGGTPGQVGLPNGVGGVAPFAGDCSVIERGIAYTFSDVYGGDVQEICHTVAQETAHALGLDHELKCQDPMTYIFGCGPKTFQDEDVVCGEDVARPCACGTATQNSVKHLFAVLGAADGQPPSVQIVSPAPGDEVAPGFTVTGSASDDSGVAKVELFIDGTSVGSKASPPFTFDTPAELAAGSHRLDLRATDTGGSTATATVDITLVVGGGGDDGTGADGDSDDGSSGDDGSTGDGSSGDDGSGDGSSGDGSSGDDGVADGSDDNSAGDATGEPDGEGKTFTGGCSAAPGGPGSTGATAMLLALAAAALVFRRRRQ